MIEEIKMILDAVDGVADLGLWALLGFVVYKLVIYMSTTGAIVFCVKLIVEKLHSVLTQKKVVEYEFDGLPIDSGVARQLSIVLRRLHAHHNARIPTRYLHSSDVDWLHKAIDEKIERERKS